MSKSETALKKSAGGVGAANCQWTQHLRYKRGLSNRFGTDNAAEATHLTLPVCTLDIANEALKQARIGHPPTLENMDCSNYADYPTLKDKTSMSSKSAADTGRFHNPFTFF